MTEKQLKLHWSQPELYFHQPSLSPPPPTCYSSKTTPFIQRFKHKTRLCPLPLPSLHPTYIYSISKSCRIHPQIYFPCFFASTLPSPPRHWTPRKPSSLVCFLLPSAARGNTLMHIRSYKSLLEMIKYLPISLYDRVWTWTWHKAYIS